MQPMLTWLARRVVKDAWLVVITWAVLSATLLATALVGSGGGLFSRLEAGSMSIPGTESAAGQQILDSLAGDSVPVTLLVRGVNLRDTEHQEKIVSALAKPRQELAAMSGVEAVLGQSSAGRFTVAHLDLTGDRFSATAERTVSEIRALKIPADTWVTGQAAGQLDFRATVLRDLPLALGAMFLATFVLLFLMTGSLLVPLKALIVNALSLAASLGTLVWVFQDGHGASLLGFIPLGGVETAVVMTAGTTGFGPAMVHEVFILARITEYRRAGHNNDTSVELGLQRSGRVVTFAALIMVAVFLAFVSGDLVAVKEIGLALAVIVALDASLVRILLVPASMTLLGEWNWWAPWWLRRLLAGSRADAAPVSIVNTAAAVSTTAPVTAD